MIHMLLGKCRNRKIAVIVSLLVSDLQILIIPALLCRSREVLRQQLPLLVEVVRGPDVN